MVPTNPAHRVTVGIVVLNWNNAHDTVECVDSVMALRCRDFILYVVDNGSDDGSGVALEVQARALAAKLGRSLQIGSGEQWQELSSSRPGDLVILRNRSNRGYAGGNNVAIRRALADGCSGVWILNNDTRVDPGALDALLDAATPGAGMVGMCVLDYDEPDRIQCMGGGTYQWWATRTRLNGAGLPYARRSEALGSGIDFVSGSCMFLTRETLEAVGELDERYFLYCEEIDFAERCRRQGRPLVVAPTGRVWHKFGSSAGSSRSVAHKSPNSVFFSARSPLILTRKHRRLLLPVAAIVRAGYGFWLLLRGHRELAAAVLRGVASGLVGRPEWIRRVGVGTKGSSRITGAGH